MGRPTKSSYSHSERAQAHNLSPLVDLALAKRLGQLRSSQGQCALRLARGAFSRSRSHFEAYASDSNSPLAHNSFEDLQNRLGTLGSDALASDAADILQATKWPTEHLEH